MNKGIKERISALVDGELSEFEVRRVLEEIELDEDLKEYWLSLQITRNGLKDNSLSYLNKDISVRVATELGEFSNSRQEQNKFLAQNKLYLVSALFAGMAMVISIGLFSPTESGTISSEVTFASEASEKIARAIASPEALNVIDRAVTGIDATLQDMNSGKKGQVYANYKLSSTGKTFRVSLSPISSTHPGLEHANSSKLAYLETNEGVFLISVSGNISSAKKNQILRNVNFSYNLK